MKKTQRILFFLIIFPLYCLAQNLKYESAADQVLYELSVFDKSVKDESVVLDIKFPNRVSCLTGIYPKKVDGTYFGILYLPTEEEIKTWKNWVTINKFKIKYGKTVEGEKEIIVEYEPGKYRSNYCE